MEVDHWSTRFSGPFVTAVGGTTGIKPETAISFSGGGFSNYFPRPSYQDKDITAYIKNLNGTYDGLYKCGLRIFALCEPSLNIVVDFRVYSATGRGYPDVAARGNNYRVVVGGKTYRIGGTSASAPVRDPRDKISLCVQLTPSVPL